MPLETWFGKRTDGNQHLRETTAKLNPAQCYLRPFGPPNSHTRDSVLSGLITLIPPALASDMGLGGKQKLRDVKYLT